MIEPGIVIDELEKRFEMFFLSLDQYLKQQKATSH